tara:strand:+ start:7370 stop:8062 length:693 start_codon:yes stop_codon:yes gene_type:complete
MVFRTLLLTTAMNLLAFTGFGLPKSGTAIQCSDSVFQESLNSVKTSVQLLNRPLRISSILAIEVYGTINQISQANFDKLIVDVGEEVLSIGPTYIDSTIRVSRNYFEFLKIQSISARTIFNFVLAHEFAHHVQSLYSRNINLDRTVGGYEWLKLSDSFEREVYTHAQIDCMALSLMKNAGMSFDVNVIEEGLISIRDECIEYRGKKFCDEAHEIRLEHVKKWFDSVNDKK